MTSVHKQGPLSAQPGGVKGRRGGSLQTIWKWGRNDATRLIQTRDRRKNARATSSGGVALGLILLVAAVLASPVSAQVNEAAICAGWDGPLMSGGRLLCTDAPTRTCLEPAFRAGAMVCLRYEDSDPADVSVPLRAIPQVNSAWAEEAERAAKRHYIPVLLFHALILQESGWNTDAVSSKGAFGLTQLMPETAAALGVDPQDPIQNLDGGARYLRAMFLKFGAWDLALAAYNAGPGAVEAYAGIPPYPETTNYVATVLQGAGFPVPDV